jgi:Asp-tRNA(Asn)/Glu-tRNA(Gln) amidotransferase A subunit family amidase
MRLREVTVRLPDPVEVWLPLAATERGQPTDLPAVLAAHEANLPVGDLCWAFNLSGHPAVSVPAGLLDGLPVGLQAVAAPHRDDLALEVARLAAVLLPDPPDYWPALASSVRPGQHD